MPNATRPIPLNFPFGGVVRNPAFGQLEDGQCHDALNVRPYDSILRRLRGGQRSGIAKYFEDAVNGTSPIQRITSVIEAFDPSGVVADTQLVDENFDDLTAATRLWNQSSNWTGFWSAGSTAQRYFENSADSGSEGMLVTDSGSGDNVLEAENGGSGSDSSVQTAIYTAALTPGTNYVIRANGKLTIDTPTDSAMFAMLFRANAVNPSTGYWVVEVDTVFNSTTWIVRLRKYTDATTRFGVADKDGNFFINFTVTGVTDWHAFEVAIAGSRCEFRYNGASITYWTMDTTASSNTQIGLGKATNVSQNHNTIEWDDFEVFSGVTPASLRTANIVAASGGSIYHGTPATGLAQATSGSSVLKAAGTVFAQAAFQKVYFADGEPDGYRLFTLSNDTVSKWEATGGVLPVGATGSTFNITGVSTGSKTFTVAEDLSGLSDGDYIVVTGSTGNDGAYTVASTSGSGPTTITVDQTVASATADGTLQQGDKACRLIALYRGRIVLAGLETDPQNWFMSAVDDPLDFDYFPSTSSETQAVAGNNSGVGLLGDVVTALIPYQDDVLFMGGDHTLWVMRSDPASGGQIDNISRQIGVVGPDAWTWDANRLYFMGQNGLYRVNADGGQLELLTRGKLDPVFDNLNYSANEIRLVYDREWQGVHIFITPQNEPDAPTDHWFWDERNDSFWRDRYPTTIGPTAVHLFDADDPDDRAVLIGGFDSYIRHFDPDALTDDGTAISSEVQFTPIRLAMDVGDAMMTEAKITLAENGGTPTFSVLADQSPEEAATNGTARYAKALRSGVNNSILRRVAANTLLCKIAHSTSGATWAYESGVVMVEPTDRSRRLER